MSTTVQQFEHFLAMPFIGTGMKKLTFSSPMATAEFSKFSGILSAALSQHHLLGFEIFESILFNLTIICTLLIMTSTRNHLTLYLLSIFIIHLLSVFHPIYPIKIYTFSRQMTSGSS